MTRTRGLLLWPLAALQILACSAAETGDGPAEPPRRNVLNLSLVVEPDAAPPSAAILRLRHPGDIAVTSLVPGNFVRSRAVSDRESLVLVAGNLASLPLLELTGTNLDDVTAEVLETGVPPATRRGPQGVRLELTPP